MRLRGSSLGLAALGVLLAAHAADALPAVQMGSPYSFYVANQTAGPQSLTASFDGSAEPFSWAGLSLSLDESDVALGGVSRLITINLSASGDLYPSPGEGAISGLGTSGPGLDLLRPFYLDDARIKLFASGGLLFTSNNLADDYRTQFFSYPWTGYFPAPDWSFIVGNAGGRGIDGITFEFTVSEVPEPGTIALLGLGLSALGLRRRRVR